MNISDFKVGEVYSFSMQNPVIYGSRVEVAELIGIAGYDLASNIAPIDQQYAQVYPSLPQGTQYSPKTCKYYIFKQLNGAKIAIADQWIVDGSIERIQRVVYQVTISDGSLGDIPKIRAALAAIGKSEITIETV